MAEGIQKVGKGSGESQTVHGSRPERRSSCRCRSFFINRPIVAMVIAIVIVVMGWSSRCHPAGRAVSRHRAAGDPGQATYVGADAQTIEQSVATPIEQQMSGVDNMNYMYSLNANNGAMRLTVDFDVETDPNTDLILAQMRAEPGGVAAAGRRPQLRRDGAEIDARRR